MSSTLLELAKSKLNITWSDEGTEARITAILEDAVPAVSNMVGLGYDYDAMAAVDGSGEVFDFTVPSLERNVLLNYVAYEWNHKAGLFREAYWQEIAACRQKHELEDTEENTDDSEESSTDDSESSTDDSDSSANDGTEDDDGSSE